MTILCGWCKYSITTVTKKVRVVAEAKRDIALYVGFENDPIIIDFVSGMTRRALGDKYKKSHRAIESYIRRRRVNDVADVVQLHDKEWLTGKLSDGWTLNQIAESLKVHREHVRKAIKSHQIDIYKVFQMRASKISGRTLSYSSVKELYDSKKSTIDIARYFGFSGDSVIRDFMRKNGIIIRKNGEHQIKHDNPKQLLAQLSDRSVMHRLYVEQELSSTDIADRLGCNGVLVQRWLRRHKFKIRHHSDYWARRKIGELHQSFINLLNNYSVKHQTCFVYSGRYNGKNRVFEIDEYLPDLKVFIEVNGDHWHGISRRHWKYQRVRNKLWSDLIKYLCVTRDYPDHRFIYVTDNNVTDAFVSRLAGTAKSEYASIDRQNFNMDQCSYADTAQFLIDNHYLGPTKGRRYYRLMVGGSTAAIAVVASPTRAEIKLSTGQECLEITRLASSDIGQNGLSYFLARVLRNEARINDAAGIVSFADQSPLYKQQHWGTIYRACNFKLISRTGWNYRYYNCDTDELIHKKTIYNRAVKLDMTESEFVKINSLHKIPEWPKLKYEYLFDRCGPH